MSMNASIATAAVGAVLVGASIIACGLLGGLPSVRLPLGTSYSVALLLAGVAAIGAGTWLIARTIRRLRRRSKNSVAAPRDGGRGSATAYVPAYSPAGGYEGRVAHHPPVSTRPTIGVRCTGATGVGLVRRRVAGSASEDGVEPATHLLPAVRDGGRVDGWLAARPGHGLAGRAASYSSGRGVEAHRDPTQTWTTRSADGTGATGLKETTYH